MGRVKRGVPLRRYERSNMLRSYYEQRELFKAGIKPALMLPYKRDIADLLKVYPYVDLGEELYILFQNEELKHRFDGGGTRGEFGISAVCGAGVCGSGFNAR